VKAVAYDVPIPGFDTTATNNLRLWSSKAASGEFDFQKFNSGEYERLATTKPESKEVPANIV
jgi:glycogen phosphorylase